MFQRALVLTSLLCAGCGSGSLISVDDPTGTDAGNTGVDAGLLPDGGHPDAGSVSQKKGPPYPIVFAHGFFGFETFAGLDFLTYFFEVKNHLALNGESLVFTPTVDPFNDSPTRAAELQAKIEEILATTGYEKVNVIAHSQGGLDIRIVAHDRPDLIASVVTVSTPHHGTPVSDLVGAGLSNPLAQGAVDALVRLAAGPLWDDATAETSLTKALAQFATQAMVDFNATYPDRPGVAFFSVAGRTGLRKNAEECDVAVQSRPSFIREFDDTVDPVNPGLVATEVILSPNPLDAVGNDGLVPVASAKWGTFLGCVPADHLDEIGQIGGASPGLGNDWRHQPFYLGLVKLLRAKGF